MGALGLSALRHWALGGIPSVMAPAAVLMAYPSPCVCKYISPRWLGRARPSLFEPRFCIRAPDQNEKDYRPSGKCPLTFSYFSFP